MHKKLKLPVCLAMVLTLMVGTMLIVPVAAFADEGAGTPSATTTAETSSSEYEVILDASNTAATIEGASYSIDEFARNNKGSGRAYEGKDIGYRYPSAGESAFNVVVFDDEILVSIPARISASFDQDSSADTEILDQLMAMIVKLDDVNSNGGVTLEQTGLPVVFASDEAYQHADCRVVFNQEVEQGYYYTILNVEPDASTQPDLSKQAAFVLTGNIVKTDDLALEAAPEGWDAFVNFLTSMDYRPFWVSLKTSLTALIFVFILGLAAARLSLKVSPRIKDILDAIFTIPMVLPPTVIGFLLLVTFGNSTALGRWLMDHGIELVFSWPAAVLAATVVAFPLMYRTVRGAFEAQDTDMLDAARTLGWSESRIFFRLMMPLAWPSIAAGTVLAFARAMGEFGATLFVAGNYAGVTQTMPIAIYFQWMGGNTDVAVFWVVVVILISFVVILFINLYARHTQRYRLGTASDQPFKEEKTQEGKRSSSRHKKAHDKKKQE